MTTPMVPETPVLVNRPNIELAQTGQWEISTGTTTLTSEDFRNAIASQDCPAIHKPVIKLGHIDPRFDGEPAVGFIDNMGTVKNDTTLVGDYCGIPKWLDSILASAYPNRSFEATWDFKCQIGHVHPFVVTAVALLGVTPPGIGTLESLTDVATLFGIAASEDGPKSGYSVSIFSKGTSTMPNPNPLTIAAGITTEDIRRAYYDSPDVTAYSWITCMELNPLQLIVTDDATGKLSRVPVTIKGNEFTFGEATPVEIQYVDAPKTANASIVYASKDESRSVPASAPRLDAMAMPGHSTATDTGTWSKSDMVKRMSSEGEFKACFAYMEDGADPTVKGSYKLPHHMVAEDGTVVAASTKACSDGIGALNGARGGVDIPDAQRQAVYDHLAKHLKDAGLEAPALASVSVAAARRIHEASTTNIDKKEGSVMDPIKLRESLGLAADASVDDVRAALASADLTTSTQPPTPDPTPAPLPVAASGPLPEGVVAVDMTVISALQASARKGELAYAEVQRNKRDEVIRDAIACGKFPPARQQYWEEYWKADPVGAEKQINNLAPNLVPLSASGVLTNGETYEQNEAYYALYPEERPNNG